MLVLQFVAFKTWLAVFDGSSYAPMPRHEQGWMRVNEFAEAVIKDILIGNSARVFRFG